MERDTPILKNVGEGNQKFSEKKKPETPERYGGGGQRK